jgi:RNA polymerase sigma-70 factor (ECF subfamily)
MNRQGPAEMTNAFTGWVSDLARDHSRRLVSVARHEGLDPEDALDAVQEAFRTFLILPQARSFVHAAEDSGVLLAVLVRNAARNMRRRHHRSVPHDRISEEPGLIADDVAVDELISRAEEHVRLAGCVNHLTEIQQAVVRMRALQELSGRETAALLGMPPDRVAVHLHRAKKALLACLVG